ncbi:carbohydrate ABC transporter permease [Alloscardovia omnicolens]|uniref:carbohydrate ABC transporter permease n=1 Tax=Alloscardovia omnicolens TaxID=419015 RepID=UPI003A68BF56
MTQNSQALPHAPKVALNSARARSSADIPWNPKVHYKKKLSDYVALVIIYGLLILTVLAMLYPLWFVAISSVSDPAAVANGAVKLLPHGLTWGGYAKVFENSQIWTGYKNTLLYCILGTLVNMVVTIPCAFALSRSEFKPRRIILFLFTVTMFFSGGLIPSYLLYKNMGILNTMWVFILPGAVSVYNVIVARSFFETSIPEELFDAAKIDGMSYIGYFVRIVLPLSSAILAVIGLYYFVGHWNDFMTGLIFVTDWDKQPLQNILQQLLLVNQVNNTANVNSLDMIRAADQIKFAIIIVSTVPLFVLYPFLQRYFNKGVMLGAVKG